MILNTPFISGWESIRLRKQKIIDEKNQLENKNRTPHTYRIREKVLLRKYEVLYVGPYPINQVWKNGNVTIHRGDVQECINIIWIQPHHE